MALKKRLPLKNIVLFVNNVSAVTAANIKNFGKQNNQKLKIAVIRDIKRRKITPTLEKIDILINCDFNKPLKTAVALKPYQDNFLAITARGETNVQAMAKIIPNVPYLKTPTSQSLEWATDKICMRERLRMFDKTISPNFAIVDNCAQESILKIKKQVGFPLVLKPASLAGSLLVSICYYEEELEQSLKKIFRKIKKVYKDNKRDIKPKVLVEQFMEGEMYSIDVYVTARGKVYYCPLVHVKTGRSIGFDDFFGYQRITPTLLKNGSIKSARLVAQKAVHALGLRSTTVHIELMRDDENGWKVIELGPRIGGWRHKMYELSHGINHSLNDVLIRMPLPPQIPNKRKGYSAVYQFFATQEGVLTDLKGIKKIKKLSSYIKIDVNKKIGDICDFAKHGGKSVCDVILFNKNRSVLMADARKIEKALIITTARSSRSANSKKAL
ncbi:MAG: ATP-grasp domain-containing protein [Patescibacteria group bacterium]